MPADEPSPAHDGDELEELRALARRVGTDPVAWETPPANLWQRIADETTHEPAPGEGGVIGERQEPALTPSTAVSRPRRGRASWLLAAAAVMVLAVAGALVWSLRSDAPAVVARTQLEQLGDTGAGHADLVELRGGGLELRLTTSGLDVEPGAFAEVWVINPDVTEMISLGPLRSDGRYELPHGLEPTGFPIVDVSIEPFDGDPTHSGNSVLRGQLAF